MSTIMIRLESSPRAGALRLFAAAAAVVFALAGGAEAAPAAYAQALERPPEDEVIYFLLPDRFENGDKANDNGGVEGSRLQNGFDPTRKGFFHGGDLAGLSARLDYIEGLGATAIWLGPIYKNKPVQGPAGDESAGYHGYWVTDFTSVDPHFGTNAELKKFVDAAHAKGIKVYLDILINHTADVIAYRECHDPEYQGLDKEAEKCPYRSKSDYPYARRGGVSGEPINPGFMGDSLEFQTGENFGLLTRPDYAYTPYVPQGEENIKSPAWLNDAKYYHNRGNSTFAGESSLYGDFSGLDDLMTEDPRVLEGFVDIYRNWISEFRIDGFRVDTARHVNPEFWNAFIPAMLDEAQSQGIPNFYIFGEAYDPDAAGLARFTRVDGFPYVLDFAFQSAVADVLTKGAPTEELARLFFMDALYQDGETRAAGLPVFVGNHDMGRFAHFLLKEGADEPLKRVELAYAMMFFLRGVPVIYSGDEQGFTGDGGDQDAREDMFASAVDIYNDNVLLGTKATTAQPNFDRRHPLYKAISDMAKLYRAHLPLRRGRQIVRHSETDGGLFAVSRLSEGGGEYLVAFNTRNEPRQAMVNVDPRSNEWKRVRGTCPSRPMAPGSYEINLPPLGYLICRSNAWSEN